MRLFQKIFCISMTSLLLTGCGNAALDPDTSMDPSKAPAVKALIASFTQSCLKNAPSYEEASVRSSFNEAPSTGQMTLLSFAPEDECGIFAGQHSPANGTPTHGDLVAMARVVQARTGGTIIAPKRNSISVEGGASDITISTGAGSERGLRFTIRN